MQVLYSSYKVSTANSYNPLIQDLRGTGLMRDRTYEGQDLRGTYKSLPYKPHIGKIVVSGKYLLFGTMYVHNR